MPTLQQQPSTTSSTSTNANLTRSPTDISTTLQQAPPRSSRRRSTPIYASPQVKSSYGAPVSESASLNRQSPSLLVAAADARRTSPVMYSRAGSSSRGSVDRGLEDSDDEAYQGESAAVRQARLNERMRNTTIGRNKVNGSSLNNTSVNIATAIFQAEQGRFALAASPSASTSALVNGSYASSASYSRKETHQPPPSAQSSSRRGPLPPAPLTMAADDVVALEEERARRRRERTKSPVLDAIAGAARALSPVSYLLKPRVAQGAPFPEEDHDDGGGGGGGYQSFASLRQPLAGTRSTTPQQDLSYLSANSAADVSMSSDLALSADRSHGSQASDYGFDEEERLMAEMEAKRARVQAAGAEPSGGSSGGGWFSGLGFSSSTSRDEPADVTSKKGGAGRGSDDRSLLSEPADEDDGSDAGRSSDSYDDSDNSASNSVPDEDPARPTKTTSRRRPRRDSDDAKTYKYRPGESASESDSTDGRARRGGRRRRSGGKVTAHGAEGMAPVVEGKKRQRRAGRGGRRDPAGDASDEDDLELVEAERPRHDDEDDDRSGGIEYDPRPSYREEEDSFIVRFHPGAQTSPLASPERTASARQRQTGRSGRPRPSLGLPNPVAGLSDLLLAVLRTILVGVIFGFNTLVALVSWLVEWPVKAIASARRSLSLVDWRKIAKPLAAAFGLLLVATIVGRRSSPASPLEDIPSSWRSGLPTPIAHDGRPPLSSLALPPDSVKELLERLARVEGTLGAVSSQGRRSAQDVEALASQLGGLERRIELSDRTMTALDGRLNAHRTDFATLEQRVQDAERAARQALDAGRLAQTAADAIEALLPARLAVRLHPQTKALEIEPAFWQAMRDVFVGRHELPASVSNEVAKQKAALLAGLPEVAPTVVSEPASWADFLAANEAALEAWSDGQLDRRAQAGAIVSRPEFLRVLQAELATAKVELEDRLGADLRRTGEDAVRSSLAESTAYADKAVKAALGRLPTPQVVPASARLAENAGSSAGTVADGDVAGLVSSMIDAALLRHSKDTLAMTDYALFSAGGRIIPHITSDTFEQPIVRWGGLLKPKVIPGRPPATALLPDINVGNCWPFAGPSGQIGILLARRILVSAITIEHAAREVSFDMAAAPREVEVWGLVEGQANLDKVAAYQEGHAASGTPSSSSLPPSPGYILLGQLEYDINAPRHVQTFAVPKDVQDLAVDIGIVVVRVASNYGADYTCLYRVRVHGDAAPDALLA